jgi:hypothetical protein
MFDFYFYLQNMHIMAAMSKLWTQTLFKILTSFAIDKEIYAPIT